MRLCMNECPYSSCFSFSLVHLSLISQATCQYCSDAVSTDECIEQTNILQHTHTQARQYESDLTLPLCAVSWNEQGNQNAPRKDASCFRCNWIVVWVTLVFAFTKYTKHCNIALAAREIGLSFFCDHQYFTSVSSRLWCTRNTRDQR